jgi:hypothetical protein
MTAIVEQVLTNIRLLKKEELELIMAEIKDRLGRQQRMEEALQAFVGTGTGFWGGDAQEYINELRSEERSF